MKKPMKTLRFNHRPEIENKELPKVKLIKKLFFVFKSLYLINAGCNACEAVCLKRQLT